MRICGDMDLYEMPLANGVCTFFPGDPDRPLDLRAETPPEIAGANHEVFRRIIEENLEQMEKCDQPVRGLFVGSHNTTLFADERTHQHANLLAVCRMMRELSEAAGHAFVPAGFETVRVEAERLDAF